MIIQIGQSTPSEVFYELSNDDYMLWMQAFLNLGWGLGNILGEHLKPSPLEAVRRLKAAQNAVVLPSCVLYNEFSTAEITCKLAMRERVTGFVKWRKVY